MWIDEESDKLKAAMKATAIHVDLLGVMLTINDTALHIPSEAISAMGSLLHEAERKVIREERLRQQKERGPY